MAAYYNEIDPYAAQWLRNLIAGGHIAPGDVDERSITDVRPDDLRGYSQCHFFAGIGGWSCALRLAGWPDDRPVWTGSCPCQPFSAAGKQRGSDDERHLWPAFFRLISECRPPVVFGEQVAGAAGYAWWDHVAADLEGETYAAAAVDIGAHSVGAPHLRQRLYWVADGDMRGRWLERIGGLLDGVGQAQRHDADGRGEVCGVADAPGLRFDKLQKRELGETEDAGRLQQSSGACSACQRFFAGFRCNRPDECDCPRCQGYCACSVADAERRPAERFGLDVAAAPRGDESEARQRQWVRDESGSGRDVDNGLDDAERKGLEGHRADQAASGWLGAAGSVAAAGASGILGDTTRNGFEVRRDVHGAMRGQGLGERRILDPIAAWSDIEWIACSDGKARPTQPGLFPLAHGVSNRVGRLRAYGNAIVPQVAAAFIRAAMT